MFELLIFWIWQNVGPREFIFRFFGIEWIYGLLCLYECLGNVKAYDQKEEPVENFKGDSHPTYRSNRLVSRKGFYQETTKSQVGYDFLEGVLFSPVFKILWLAIGLPKLISYNFILEVLFPVSKNYGLGLSRKSLWLVIPDFFEGSILKSSVLRVVDYFMEGYFSSSKEIVSREIVKQDAGSGSFLYLILSLVIIAGIAMFVYYNYNLSSLF
jgi:hypothetical protein